ncbi:MAG: sirohydrochlorin ferrochelatase [Acidobacteriota bacterium]|nr:sirohydrochlorin ferrochelatase [Acidobacteriota bacterium]
MNALLVMAHGSPRPEANDDVRRVAELLRARGEYPIVVIGYLDCNQPDIPAAIDECVAAGASSIAAVPYLLHSGKHFLLDLPALLDEGSLRHPQVTIVMGDYIGREPQLADVLRDRVTAAGA